MFAETVRRLLFLSIWCGQLLCFCAVGPAASEDVFIVSATEQRGHGWLFGARGDEGAECWVAVPAHVIKDEFSGAYLPFTFKDRSGRQGEAARPIPVEEVPAALRVLGGISDLAFARVYSGRSKGDCLSRLGLPSFLYENALLGTQPLRVIDLIPTSFGIFDVTVLGGRADGVGGGLLRLRPTRIADSKRHLKLGISGAIARLLRSDGTFPFAMILKVDPTEGVALALRFDLIRAAFEHVAETASPRVSDQPRSGLPFRFLNFSAVSLEPGLGPSSLIDPTSCWIFTAESGQTVAQFTLEIAAGAGRISAVSVFQSESCGSETVLYHIDQRLQHGRGWSRVATCQSLNPAKSVYKACRIDLSAPRQLRLSFEAIEPVSLLSVEVR